MSKDMKTKVLFVCLGNICRSPTGEGVFQHLVKERNLNEHYHIDSAGTNGFHDGERADARMRKHATKRGLSLDSISRQVTPEDFIEFDHIIAMDDSNVTNLRSFCPSPEYFSKVRKMTDFAQNMDFDYVPDPYYGGEEGFELVLDLVEDSCEGLLAELEQERSTS